MAQEFEQITSPPQAQSEVLVNESLEAVQHIAVYGYKAETSSGLTWGYYGGRWNGFNITTGTLTLTNTATNYIVVARATGVVSTSTSSTNHTNTTDYARLYTVVVAGGVPTTITDERLDSDGILASAGGGGGGVDRSTVSALSTSGTVNIDVDLGDYFTLAPTGNVTSITFSNLPASGHGASLMIRITQDSTPRTVTWPASFKWAGGAAGTVSTGSGAVDLLAITSFDQGTNWRATLAKAFA
jgi:hypothetical protein